MSVAEMVAAAFVMAAGASVQGSVGFGMNVVAAPILIQIETDLVPGPLLAAALMMSLLVAVRDRVGIDRSALLWALVGRAPGVVAGTALLLVLSTWGLSVFLAGVILVGAALSVSRLQLPHGRSFIAAGGFVSGMAGTTTGVGGPPLALTLQHIEPRQLRGTMAVYFLFGATMSLVALGVAGEFGARHIVPVAILVPGQLLGYALSGRLARVLDRGYARPVLLTISVAAAVSLLIRALV